MATKKKPIPKTQPIQVDQIELIGAITKHLVRRHGNLSVIPRQYNAIVSAANLIVREFGIGFIESKPSSGVMEWLKSDDTGISSIFMCYATTGHRNIGELRYGHPLDPSDFARCMRFLEAVPEARHSLTKLSNASREWKALIEHWYELEGLYYEELKQETAPKLYARMQELLSEPADLEGR